MGTQSPDEVTISEWPLDGNWDLIEDVMNENYEESCLDKDNMILDPNKAAYKLLEDFGCLVLLVAVKDKEVIGYSSNFVAPHLHYSSLKVATNDVFCISKAHRSLKVGSQLKEATKVACKAKGATQMVWRAKEDTPLYHLFKKENLHVQEIAFDEQL